MTPGSRDGSGWERVPELVEAALALPEGGVAGFLRTIGDPALRQEVASLVAVASDAATYFEGLAETVDEVAADLAHHAQSELAGASEPGFMDDSSGTPVEPVPGQMIAHYRIEERLGAGGMGVVYRAFDTHLERTVALKIRSTGRALDGYASDRFLVEARAAAALDHPNVCTIHEVGVAEDGSPFIAMAFYPGETLEQTLRRGPLDPRRAAGYALQIAGGLAAAHALGITHRDVKPGNVMVTADGTVKLLDFGIAQRSGDGTAASVLLVGTIEYMSPEQLRGAALDHRTDLWSLGVVLYEMCTGTRPFRRADRRATADAIRGEAHPSPAALAPRLPQRLEAIIDRLLEKDPARRYRSAAELLSDLTALTTEASPGHRPEPVPKQRWRRRAAVLPAVGTAAALGLAAVFALGLQPPARTRILLAAAVGDSVAGDVVSERLRLGLADSRHLELVTAPLISAALERMGRDPAMRLAPEVAHEVALREGIPAYVHVTVDRIGMSFALGALLVAAETGEYLDAYTITALSGAELNRAADSLAIAIRERFGDRLESVPEREPRLAVTTDSIAALNLYLQAVQSNRVGDFRKGIQLLEATKAIDAGFADAYLTEAFAWEQIGLRGGRGQAQVLAAWQLRDGLTDHERYTVDADYAWQIEGDLDRAVQALHDFHQEAARRVPGRVLNRRSYGLALVLNGRLAEAEPVLQEGRRLAPCPVTKSILASVLHSLNRDGEAHEVVHEAIAQWPTNPLLAMDSAHFAAASGAYRTAHEVARNARFGASSPFALRSMAVFDAVEGRLGEASEHLEELRGILLEDDLLAPTYEVTIGLGRLRFVAGDTIGGVGVVEQFLAGHPLEALPVAERPYLSLALFFADARRAERSRSLTEEYERAVPRLLRGPDEWMRHRVRAAQYLATDDPVRALDELRLAGRSPRIWSEWFSPLLFEMEARPELARAYDRLGRPDSAIVVYERYLAARVLHRSELDAFQLAHARRRLAALYDAAQQGARAALQRDALEKLWRNADPELQRFRRPTAAVSHPESPTGMRRPSTMIALDAVPGRDPSGRHLWPPLRADTAPRISRGPPLRKRAGILDRMPALFPSPKQESENSNS